MIFVLHIHAGEMILRKRCPINPCSPVNGRQPFPRRAPGKRGRKREEKPELLNRTTEPVGQATMDKTTEGASRCRHAQQPTLKRGKSRMTGWPKREWSQVYRHIADRCSLTTRPGIKHVLTSREMDMRNRVTVDALQHGEGNQPQAQRKDCPKQSPREIRIRRRGHGKQEGKVLAKVTSYADEKIVLKTGKHSLEKVPRNVFASKAHLPSPNPWRPKRVRRLQRLLLRSYSHDAWQYASITDNGENTPE